MKKSRVWQAIVPGTQNKPQDTLQIRKTPWQRRDETASCRPSARAKASGRQLAVPGTQNKPQDTLQIRETPWHGVTKQPPAVPLPGPNVTPEPNEKIKGLAVPGKQKKPQDTLQIRKTPWHGVTKQPPAAPSHKTPFKSGKHPGTA